jgi:multidrug transporter EmrE-like cation transporter
VVAHELLVYAKEDENNLNPASFALVLTGVLLNALAQILLKLGANRLGPDPFASRSLFDSTIAVFTQWPYLMGFTCYGFSLVIWIVALTKVPVTIAYPMLSIGYIVNALIARFWLGETLGLTGWFGIAFICFGVSLVARTH